MAPKPSNVRGAPAKPWHPSIYSEVPMIRAGAVVTVLLMLLSAPAVGAESIRVGYLGPLTGIFAAAGKDMLDGLKMAFEQVNYEVAGRKIELIEEDDEGNPATAQAKYRKLVAQDRIHVLDGVLLSNIGYALVQVFVAGHAGRFSKQYGESALHGKVPLIGTGVYTDQSSLQGMGDEVIGHVGTMIWSPTLDNTANRVFTKIAEAKVKRTPSYFHAVMYSSGRWIIEAAKALGGNLEDRDRFLAALRRATDTTPDPRGPIKLDEYGNPTENVYIVRVEKVGGRLQNTVVHTYPMVSQFWTYRPDEFLKTPAYDRNYPPVKP